MHLVLTKVAEIITKSKNVLADDTKKRVHDLAKGFIVGMAHCVMKRIGPFPYLANMFTPGLEIPDFDVVFPRDQPWFQEHMDSVNFTVADPCMKNAQNSFQPMWVTFVGCLICCLFRRMRMNLLKKRRFVILAS